MQNSIDLLASFRLPSAARLLPTALCPDKDLLLLITSMNHKDRLSLWNLQGSKKWEIEVDASGPNPEEIVALTWSPDCQFIAVAHDPPRITIHSVQNGHEQRSLPIKQNLLRPSLRLTAVLWFQDEKPKQGNTTIPDILKRENDIPGSAHSMLKMLPLLDALQDDTKPLGATDLFAFEGSKKRPSANAKFPEVIAKWPTLPPDPLSASMKPADAPRYRQEGEEELDEVDDRNTNSILCAGDDMGNVHCFLDGSFPLGTFLFNTNFPIASLYKKPDDPTFSINIQTAETGTCITSTIVDMTLLKRRSFRDVARTSSTARELTWYIMRCVKEMQKFWYGQDLQGGARIMGPKWVEALEKKQTQFGQKQPSAVLDLSCLLLTGRASEALSDFLGSGEQTTERGMNKWESTVFEALLKVRDYAEKRVVPAAHRLHLMIEEAQGWAQLPTFACCEFSASEAKGCLQAIQRLIMAGNWLAKSARVELTRFREFMGWLRYEIAKNAQAPDSQVHIPPRYDIMQANEYMMSGLKESVLDKWFSGQAPKFSLEELGNVGEGTGDLAEVMLRARKVANNPTGIEWQHEVKRRDLSGLDRNLELLVQELALRGSRLFSRTTSAACASASVSHADGNSHFTAASDVPLGEGERIVIRERTARDGEEGLGAQQHLAMRVAGATVKNLLLIVRICYTLQVGGGMPEAVGFALGECSHGSHSVDIMDADFFDESLLVIAFRSQGDDYCSSNVGTANYGGLEYQERPVDVKGLTREQMVIDALKEWRDGKLIAVRLEIAAGARQLTARADDGVELALNGRVGRRVACVLDKEDMGLEILDMAGEADTISDDGEGSGGFSPGVP